MKLDNKYRPVLSAEEVIGLVSLMESSIHTVHSMGLQPTLAKLQNLKFKIQASIARPAYVTTGIPSGRKGWSAQAAGNLEVDESGELSIVETQADILRNGLAEEKEKFLAMTTQGSFAAKEIQIKQSIDLVIQQGVVKLNTDCINAVNEFFAENQTEYHTTAFWKYLRITQTNTCALFSEEQISWLEKNIKEH